MSDFVTFLDARFADPLTAILPLPFGRGEGKIAHGISEPARSFRLTPTLFLSAGERESRLADGWLSRASHLLRRIMGAWILLWFAIFSAPAQDAHSILNSKHNLSYSGPGTIRSATEGDVCVFC